MTLLFASLKSTLGLVEVYQLIEILVKIDEEMTQVTELSAITYIGLSELYALTSKPMPKVLTVRDTQFFGYQKECKIKTFLSI